MARLNSTYITITSKEKEEKSITTIVAIIVATLEETYRFSTLS